MPNYDYTTVDCEDSDHMERMLQVYGRRGWRLIKITEKPNDAKKILLERRMGWYE